MNAIMAANELGQLVEDSFIRVVEDDGKFPNSEVVQDGVDSGYNIKDEEMHQRR